jgi:hypothetical protein
MKNLLVATAFLMAGFSATAQAMDLGFQGGLSGSFAVIGHYGLDKKSSIRGFYNSRTVDNVGVSSIGAAYEYNFTPNVYGALGLQMVSVDGTVSSWSDGLASYVAVGYKDKLSGNMYWHGEYNNFHSLAVGLTLRF